MVIKTNWKSMISQYLTYLRYLMGGWKKMKESYFGHCYHTRIYLLLVFYPIELSSKDLSDYKNSRAYSYINQDGFNLCKTIIFQEVNTVSSEVIISMVVYNECSLLVTATAKVITLIAYFLFPFLQFLRTTWTIYNRTIHFRHFYIYSITF